MRKLPKFTEVGEDVPNGEGEEHSPIAEVIFRYRFRLAPMKWL